MANLPTKPDFRTLGTTSVIVLAGVIILHYLLRFLKAHEIIGEEFEATVYHLYCGIIPFVHASLEKGRIKLSFLPWHIVPIEGYALPWYRMAVYGLTLFVALGILGAFVAVLFLITLGLMGIVQRPNQDTVNSLTFFWELFIMFFLGRWIGIRCDKYLVTTVVAIALFGYGLGAGIDLLVTSGWAGVFQWPGASEFRLFGFNTVAFFIAGVAGLIMGHRERASQYLQYLLSRVGLGARATIIQLAYEEAKRSS
jgi:hypothetical protein